MNSKDIVHAELLDELAFTLDDLARACGMQAQWLRERVEADLIGAHAGAPASWRFGSAELARARRLAQLEAMFDVNQEAAAFMADLIEETTTLRRQMRFVRLHPLR